ncbi:cytochrome b5 reductase 4 isoform X1 [Anopheles merus]|nr:cytochrome b5 reductase 4 isoform X1 [Anopheles merus]XP_041781395.1 cytochrome b5 reductase 4 isoform X1 [Anopheles merus]XP_041781396.1 cytochrome b5 reductase 4 isoform X1 [Anopheles merus]
MMSLCGWLKTFKRKGKNAVGADEDAGGRTGCDVDETREETGEADEPGPTNGKRSGGWGRKIKSVTKLVTGERREEAAPKGKDANLDENEPAGDDGPVECDDEGNPRNKTALKPGHSLMDWIRLGNSGTDLTGTGGRIVPVSHAELAKHDRAEDAWMAIRGKVYNVTRYMNFHPGGADELMRGAGKDATRLFEEVHAWVNYESLLAKCYIGPLRNTVTINLADSSTNPNSKLPPPPPSFAQASKLSATATPTSPPTPTKDTTDTASTTPPPPSIVSSASDDSLKLSIPIVPRFDWIQKTAELTLIFYTRSLANPGVMVECVDHLEVTVNILLESSVQHRYRFHLANNVRWPCTVRTSLESGKIELMFNKLCPALWTSYGQMTYERRENCELQLHEYDVATRVEITHDSCALLLRPKNNSLLQVTPVGHHVSVSASIDGEYVSRSYTPVPASCVSTDCPGTFIPLLVKSYQDGCLSKHLTRPVPLGTSLQVSQPSGNFALSKLRHHNRFALLAAGSGLTPMLALLHYLLERNSNRIEHICLLYFNKTEADIWCREMLENLCKKDKRFTLKHYLSEVELPEPTAPAAAAATDSEGNRSTLVHGRVTPDIIRQLTTKDSPLYATYCCLCGPKPFNELCQQYFQQMPDHNPKHLHCFQG